MTRTLALLLAALAAPAAADQGAGASEEQRAAFAGAQAALGTGWDAEHAACIIDTVARERGAHAADELLALTLDAAGRQDRSGGATLQFVGRHGDGYYGIVAECGAPDVTDN